MQKLPEGTVKFEVVSTEIYTGYLETDPSNKSTGTIKLDPSNKSNHSTPIKTVPFDQSKYERLKSGDKVQFNLSTCLKTKKSLAVNVKLVESDNEQQQQHQGIITMLKDDYGFIELIPRSYLIKANNKQQQQQASVLPQRDIFFHISSVKNSTNELEIGDEVEFRINRRCQGDQKVCAESISRLKSGTIKLVNASSTTVYKGRIVQQLRSHGAKEYSQACGDEAYFGKVLVTSPKKENESVYEFGMFGLVNRKKNLQVGDMVTFQLVSFGQDGAKRAVNLQTLTPQGNGSNSDVKKGKIDSIKGHVGLVLFNCRDP